MRSKLVLLVAGLMLVSATAVWAAPASDEGRDIEAISLGSQAIPSLNVSLSVQSNPLVTTDARDAVANH